MFRWLRDVSIAKKLYFTVGIMALLIGLELFALFFSLGTLSSLRAYVGGEGLWSKAQKDAIFHLYKYGIERDRADYQQFWRFMAVPAGDAKARRELARAEPDLAVARQGFLEGRNHPDDIAGMITLVRRFHKVYYIDKAISIWSEGEALTARLIAVAGELEREIASSRPGPAVIGNLLARVERINQELTVLEDEFSYTLGEGSRWLEGVVLKILLVIAVTVEITGLVLAVSVSRGIQKGLAELIFAASEVAKGIYRARARLFSRDEIGVLAGSFNLMAEQLERSAVQRFEAETALRLACDRLGAQVGELASANGQLRHEISERERAEAALRASRRLIEQVTEVCPAMIFIYDTGEGRRVYGNREVEAVLGYGPAALEALGPNMLGQLVHEDDRARLPEIAARLRDLADGQTLELEYRMRHADGSWRWLLGRHAAFARDEAGRVTQVIGAAVDITARKAAEARVEHLALHDALTGLPNRTLLLDRLGHALTRSRRERGGTAVMAFDLDGFKDVNDSFGHDAGDRLLRAVAARVGGLIRESDTLARTGGDEFALVQAEVPGPAAAAALARKVLAGLALPFDLDGQEVHASASLGIALFPGDGQGPAELLRSADLALYRAKQEGRRRYRLFDPAMDAEARHRRRVERELRRALERNELVLHYQPQLDLKTGRFAAVEALVRWNHPKRGLVPPGEFVPVAETSGLIHPLGAWVLREACRQAQAWRTEGLPLAVAVNVSPAQLRHPDGLGAVEAALRTSGLDPRLLELEITEGLLVELGGGAVGAQLAGLAARGVRLAIDDFGTGYSSLAYLRRLPVQRIKIDRSFVDGIGADSEDEAVVQAIVGLGHALGKTVVAEGVEREAQLAFLRRLRCDAAQGFLLSRPQPVAELEGLLLAAA